MKSNFFIFFLRGHEGFQIKFQISFIPSITLSDISWWKSVMINLIVTNFAVHQIWDSRQIWFSSRSRVQTFEPISGWWVPEAKPPYTLSLLHLSSFPPSTLWTIEAVSIYNWLRVLLFHQETMSRIPCPEEFSRVLSLYYETLFKKWVTSTFLSTLYNSNRLCNTHMKGLNTHHPHLSQKLGYE